MLIPKGLPIDPRDNLERARLSELLAFAAEQGVEIPAPLQDKAIVIRKILRQRGLTRIRVPVRILGQKNNPAAALVDAAPAAALDAADDLMRQVMQAAPAPVPVMPLHPEAAKDVRKMLDDKSKRVPAIVTLRQECKARGIKFALTDKAVDLRAKLDGKQDAA